MLVVGLGLALLGGCGGGDDGGGAAAGKGDGAGTEGSQAAAGALSAAAAAAEGDGEMSDEAQALMSDYSLDEGDCAEVESPVPGVVAAVSCDFSPVTYELARMSDEDRLAEGFADQADDEGVEPTTWYFDDDPDVTMGQVFTLASGGKAHIRWTNDERLVLAHASQAGGDTLADLEEWWGSDGSVIAEPEPEVEWVAGDCLDLPSGGTGEPAGVDCAAATAEVKVVEVHPGVTETDCPDSSDRTWSLESTDADGASSSYALCLATVVSQDADGVLAVGSCLAAVPSGEGQQDVTEHPCGAPGVTHKVAAGAASGGACSAATTLSISKSDAEVAASGAGVWCLTAP
jgi:hypothetical protein